MESFRHHRSPSSERFLALFSPPPPDDSNPTTGVELHEAEVLWTFAPDDAGPRPAATANPSRTHFLPPSDRAALRRPLDRSFGILAALPEDGSPAPAAASAAPLLQRKPSISSASSSASSTPSSSSSSTTAARMISAIPKPKPECSLSVPAGRTHHLAQSLPVNVPVVPRRARRFEMEATDGADDGDGHEIMPPHEIVARTFGRESPMTTFSVLEGAGRTLKGRDLRRVRDAVFRQTGASNSIQFSELEISRCRVSNTHCATPKVHRHKEKPPSTVRLAPLTYLDSSPPKYATASATSSAVGFTPLRLADLSRNASIAASSIPTTPIISGVITPCGDTQFTRTPCPPSSAAALFISPTTACFEQAYETGTTPPSTDAALPVITMLPRRAGAITRAACFVARNAPTTLTAITRSNSALSLSARPVPNSRKVPALLNMMSSFP
ncbi:hypothetical protein MUK42_26739 [Musa troglodytarum]|uniref:Uncharacterized protein n=1 Tax=Musa troglodytarum TaxID=320322 RepID=A0A9E7F053_9LILI|nr:hypothetical protein MUK42_26739 [Musa troglodytarum]